MGFNRTTPDRWRFGRTATQSALFDAWDAGRIDRRTLLRHGAAIGLRLPLLVTLAGIVPPLGATIRARAAGVGGVLRIGQLLPGTAIEPTRITDIAGIVQLSAVGEYLCLNGAGGVLRPMLALSWAPNSDGSLWTFTLRKSVRFHDGRPMTADDVVATFERLADADSGSNALALFEGFLAKGGTRKIDAETVEFRLDKPHGNFPYLVSSDNYNAIILPADYRGDFENNFVATGPFKLEKFSPRVGSSFVRNPDYWGAPALVDRLEYSFLPDAAAQIHALEAGEADIVQPLPVPQAAALVGNPGIEIIAVSSGAHHQVHMRCDQEPFRDPRVRRALALTLDRPGLVSQLVNGQADLGNDSPLAPAFASTDPSVAQRARNVAEARQLMDAAGFGNGYSVKLTTEKFLEIPAYAQAIAEAAKTIGARIEIDLMDQGAYYGDGVFGRSPWLDSALGITDYEHRGLPNVPLTASLRGDGAWNAARYRNPDYDRLVSDYIAALDIDAQRRAAREIETTLLADTPVLFAYFHKALTALRKGTTGVKTTAHGHLLLGEALPTGPT